MDPHGPAPGAWSRGTRIAASVEGYELLEPVSDDRSGSVWTASLRDRFGHRQKVAIKALRDGAFEDPDGRATFLEGARLSSGLRHPTVARVLDFGVDGDSPYIVTEWVEGDTLRNLCSAAHAYGGIPLGVTLRIVADACEALHVVHQARDQRGEALRLVYCDVSRSSVLVSIDGSITLTNFAVATEEAATRRAVRGTRRRRPGYLSPEQVLGRRVDRRSDIFSVGTMLYLLLTGRHPFRDADERTTARNIAAASPMFPQSIAPWIGPRLEATVLRALRLEPGERFATAWDLRAALLESMAEVGHCEPDDVGAFARQVFPDRFSRFAARSLETIELDDDELDESDDQAETVRRAAFVAGSEPQGVEALAASGVYPIVDEDEIALDENEQLQGMLREVTYQGEDATGRLPMPPASIMPVAVDAAAIADEDTAVLARSLAGSRRRATAVVIAGALVAACCALLLSRPESVDPSAPPAAATEPIAAPVAAPPRPADPPPATASPVGATAGVPTPRPAASVTPAPSPPAAVTSSRPRARPSRPSSHAPPRQAATSEVARPQRPAHDAAPKPAADGAPYAPAEL